MYYAGEPYDSVLAQFKALLDEPEFFARLTGAQGSGKSALIEQAVQYYQQQGYLSRYFSTNPDSPIAFRNTLLRSFGLQKIHNFQRNLQDYLSNEALTHKGIVLVFDDCHLMNNATLLEVTKLTDIQISNSCMLSIIICGSDKLDERLNRDHELRPVLQRITLSAHLRPLDKKGTASFLQKLFDTTNQQGLVFEPQALALLFDVSKGLPQRIIEIGLLSSTLYRSQELSTPVSKSALAQVLRHPSLAMRGYTRRRSDRKIAIAAAGFAATMLFAVAVSAWYMLRPTPATIAPDTTGANLITPTPPRESPVVAITDDESAVVATAEQTSSLDNPDVTLPLPQDTLPPLGGIAGTGDIAPPLSSITEINDITSPSDAALELQPAPGAASTTAEQPQSTAETAVTVSMPDSAEQALQGWITAWQSGDVDAYFSFYHNDFFPRGFDSVGAWQDNRRRNIASREWITMQISELSINHIAERTTQFEFWLDYQSPGYRDRTQKQVLMRLGDQGWQIVQEINLEIIYL